MISFIIIGKNEGERLIKALSSLKIVVEEDNLSDYEVLYVDSQSSDKSLDVAKNFGARTYQIIGECNAAIARCIGALEAKGDILFFLDGDMEIVPGFIPQIINENGKMVYPFVSGIFDDIIYDKDWNYILTSRRFSLKEGEQDAIQNTTGGLFVIEKHLWLKVGGMDTRFAKSQDLDLGLRLAKIGCPLHRKAILAAKHHMISYFRRGMLIGNKKYSALLFRCHLLNPHYYETFIRSQYTTVALVISLIFLFITPWSIVFYISSIIYQIIRVEMLDKSLHLELFYKIPISDIAFIWYALTYYPKKKELKYRMV